MAAPGELTQAQILEAKTRKTRLTLFGKSTFFEDGVASCMTVLQVACIEVESNAMGYTERDGLHGGLDLQN